MAASHTRGPEQGKGGLSLMKFVLKTLKGPLGGGAFQGPRSPTLIGEKKKKTYEIHVFNDSGIYFQILMWPK